MQLRIMRRQLQISKIAKAVSYKVHESVEFSHDEEEPSASKNNEEDRWAEEDQVQLQLQYMESSTNLAQ